jgi:hypothetical protein
MAAIQATERMINIMCLTSAGANALPGTPTTAITYPPRPERHRPRAGQAKTQAPDRKKKA